MPGALSRYLRDARTSIATEYAEGRVLELGCGDAEIYRANRGRISEYTGIDIRRDLVDDLGRTYPEASFFVRNIDEEPLPEVEVDVILVIALIEHLFNQARAIEAMLDRLAPRGRIVITTPTPFGNDVVHRLGASIGLFARSAANHHVVIYNKKRFEILARHFDLEIERYKRFQVGCNQLVVLRRRAG